MSPSRLRAMQLVLHPPARKDEEARARAQDVERREIPLRSAMRRRIESRSPIG
jgi:hypothetical protein